MGFGSYDEDDDRGTDASEIEVGDDDRNDHEGSVEFETEETTDELVERLQDMKAKADETED